MIVEDSAVVRTLLEHMVGRDPRLAVASAVASAEEAIATLGRVRPDVISMDVRLPGIDGLEATRRIMAETPTPIVVIAGSVEDETLGISMNALRAGALSVVEKPVGTSHADYATVARDICTQLYIMSQVGVVRRRVRDGATMRPPVAPRVAAQPPRVIALAASTGGPQALAKLLGALPADLPVPVLLVQHMGAAFMPGFAAWLDGVVPQAVALAVDREPARPGCVHVAPGDRHLEIGGDGTLIVSGGAPVGNQRPAATRLFASVARGYGAAGLAVALTGMGEDGGPGIEALRRAGGVALAEHESTAVVYGMPAAAVRSGATALPLDQIAPHLLRLLHA